MITTRRHKKIQMWLIFHSLRAVIVPVIRSNIDYLFVFKVSNSKLLTSVYEEYYSMFDDFQDQPRKFAQFYRGNIFQAKHGCLFLNTVKHEFSPNVSEWQLMTLEMPGSKGIKHAHPNQPHKTTGRDAEKEDHGPAKGNRTTTKRATIDSDARPHPRQSSNAERLPTRATVPRQRF
jgi:hypothetical protein